MLNVLLTKANVYIELIDLESVTIGPCPKHGSRDSKIKALKIIRTLPVPAFLLINTSLR